MEKNKIKDRHLDVPAEANRDKHANFVAAENNDVDPSTEKTKGALDPENLEHNDNDPDNSETRNKNAE
jgi:hypothetical protein